MPRLRTLVDQHRRHYEKTEREGVETARRLYLGDSWGRGVVGGQTTDSDRRMFASKAIIYAIADTAMSSLVGPTPRVAPMPTNPKANAAVSAVGGLMDWVFRANRMRRRISTSLIDAILAKRGCFKTSFDDAKGQPVIRAIDPTTLFFDLTVRDPDDISYWLEATVIPWKRFVDLRDRGVYSSDKIGDVKPDRYPRWLLDSNWTQQQTGVLDAQRYVVIWEYYDVERGRAVHYAERNDVTLFEDSISYMPYSMYSLNPSGVDCSGISEVQLLLNSQRTVDDLLTLWKRIAYLQVPKTFFDAGRIAEDSINDMVRANVGAYIPLHPRASMSPDARFSNLFFAAPVPEVPIGVKEMIAKTEDDMAFTSGLVEAARGRITGARTATEMAIVDAWTQTRLSARTSNMNEAIEDAARKAFYLCKRSLPAEKLVRVSGGRFAPISVATLADVDMDFEMVAYNALRRNPAVVLDTLVQMLPVFANAPNVVIPALIETISDLLALPSERFLLSQEQMEAMAQEAAQAQAQAQGWAQTKSLLGQVQPRSQPRVEAVGAAPVTEAETMRGAAVPPGIPAGEEA